MSIHMLGRLTEAQFTWGGAFLILLAFASLVAYQITLSRLQERREAQALKLAPRVYEAGGDAAALLRALSSTPLSGSGSESQAPAGKNLRPEDRFGVEDEARK